MSDDVDHNARVRGADLGLHLAALQTTEDAGCVAVQQSRVDEAALAEALAHLLLVGREDDAGREACEEARLEIGESAAEATTEAAAANGEVVSKG